MSQQPKFKVGEQCIVRSKDEPEYNGEYTVVAVVFQAERGTQKKYKGATYGFSADEHGRWYYDIGIEEKGRVVIAGEPVMFKKHQPGEMSFDELMQSLTNKSKA